ncbi:hypothetical protein V2J09_022816 [Rumex salicifolius]
MEEDMDVDVYEVVEVDLDYEFEASRFFDFTREETEEEACEAENWFESGKSYPPSPFVANLFSIENIFAGSVNVSPKAKCPDVADDEEIGEQNENIRVFGGTTQTVLKTTQNGNLLDYQRLPHGLTAGSCRGLTFYDHFSEHTKNLKTGPAVKPYTPRSSTLMKPTASQLAKQNPRNQVRVGGSRFQKILPNASSAPCDVEIQASKRQKLDGGNLRKDFRNMIVYHGSDYVGDLKQPSNLVHKVPKKVGNVPNISRMKITIPMEPDFSTSNRAHKSRQMSSDKADKVTGRTFTFRARPLNRKILEGPTLPLSKKSTPQVPVFEVFHLKTMERAQQNTSVNTSTLHQPSKAIGEAVAGSLMKTVNKVGSRLKAVNSQNEDTSKSGHSFKARPVDKKLFSSRGDLGVFRNTKRAVTVPKEFDFQTQKRTQQNPLSELFGKLSLAPESGSQFSASSKFPHPSYGCSQGPKENRGRVFQQDTNIKDLQKGKPLSTLVVQRPISLMQIKASDDISLTRDEVR